MKYPGAAQYRPDTTDLTALADAAASCRGCDLYEDATQTVFGRGSAGGLMLVGEQPGDVEDVAGEPFVGPAGQVLNRALAEAGLQDTPSYVTNAVKHFRWKAARGGKRRIHEKPSSAQATACRPWLAAEIAGVRPKVLLALGATAAASLFGPGFRLTQHRGEKLPWPPEAGDFADDDTPIEAALATVHPSAVLRAPADRRDDMYAGLVKDLYVVAALLG
jgi:uracil-DNA glycosylase family protein